jgi:hypothetical protein
MKLTKQMLHAMITEEVKEGLRRNPTVSPERLHQLRIKFAKKDPGQRQRFSGWNAPKRHLYNKGKKK